MASPQPTTWTSEWAKTHGAAEPEQVYEAPDAPQTGTETFDHFVQHKTAAPLLAIAEGLGWRRAGRAHLIRMVCCGPLSLIPMLWFLRWAMLGFGIAWIYCVVRYFTVDLRREAVVRPAFTDAEGLGHGA